MFAWILNTKPLNGGFGRRDHARAAVARLRRRRPLRQRRQYFLHAEVVDARSEEHRRLASREELREIERRACAAQEIDVVAKRFDLVREELGQPRVVDAFDDLRVLAAPLLARREAPQAIVAKIEHAAKRLAHADRPGDGRAVDGEHRLDLLDERQGLAHLAVHLVDERDDGRCAEAAHFEQLDGLLFHALRGIDHHDRRVDRR
jgi:hypothetical protein